MLGCGPESVFTEPCKIDIKKWNPILLAFSQIRRTNHVVQQ